MNINPYHEIRDTEKLNTIIASMSAHGWVGAPIVVDGEYQALTGSHRLAAADKVNDMREQDWTLGLESIEIPTIDIREIWEEAGMSENIDTILTYEFCDEYITIVDMLPATICEKYGLDIH